MSAHDAKGDALKLLLAIHTEQAHGQVGALVFAFAAARSAGLRPGTERYEEALWRLGVGGGFDGGRARPPEIAAEAPFGRNPHTGWPWRATAVLAGK